MPKVRLCLLLFPILTGCSFINDSESLKQEPVLNKTSYRVSSVRVKKNSNISETLKNLGMNSQEVYDVTESARSLLDFSKVLVGTELIIFRDLPPLKKIMKLQLKISDVRDLIWNYQDGNWKALFKDKDVQFRALGFSGEVSQSLWDSALESGLSPQIIIDLADILAWQVDFAREVRKGDYWRILVNQRLVDGKPLGWGKILAAEYKGYKSSYIAVLYPEKGRNRQGYFNLLGQSMRGQFLKSPIKFGRISSRFQKNRFHPILKVRRPHLGVDYAAPRGTPVRAVGDGVVFRKGYTRGSGKFLKIRHNSIYKTAYRHLSRFARGIKRRSHVRQGQIIGYVGSTGLATGPHLHFEFYQNDRFIDPLGQKFPRVNSLPDGEKDAYKKYAEKIISYFPLKRYEEKSEASKFRDSYFKEYKSK